MIRITDVVAESVLESPLLEEGLRLGIINLSALARRLRPRVEKALERPLSDAAVMMALKRLAPTLGTRAPVLRRTGGAALGDLTVRSNLVELTFHRSPTIADREKRLFAKTDRDRDAFLTYTHGLFEVMLIVSAPLEAAVMKIFEGEPVVSRVGGLSAIVVRLSAATVRTPGVYYAILKRLAWQNLNVIDVVSTYTEFTIVVEHRQVDAAFTALRRYVWP